MHGTPDALNNLAGYPLSDMICTNLTDDQTAGSDVPFEELGLNNQDIAGKRVAGFSAASGTSPEAVLATTDFVGGHTYIAVWGANGAHSDQPYSVQVETSQPSDVLSVANQDLSPKPVVSTPAPVSTPVPAPADQGPQTLFVTQAQRIDAIYGTATDKEPFENDVLPTLELVCALPSVEGEVVSVPSGYYDSWDQQPWNVELANGVTEQIRSLILGYLQSQPSIKYVVLVGDDEVIPQRRVPDGTVLSNERAYADFSALTSDSPLLASMYDSQMLTDDFYVTHSQSPTTATPLHPRPLGLACCRDARRDCG